MKIRNGFVSNSSSSSFIVIGKHKILDNCQHIELTLQQRDNILHNMKIEVDENTGVFLTQYISDCSDLYPIVSNKIIEYDCGGHGEPYDEDNFYCVYTPGYMGEEIWIKREDYFIDNDEVRNIMKLIDSEILDKGYEIDLDENQYSVVLRNKTTREEWEIKRENHYE